MPHLACTCELVARSMCAQYADEELAFSTWTVFFFPFILAFFALAYIRNQIHLLCRSIYYCRGDLSSHVHCLPTVSDESNYIQTTSWLTINLTVNNSVSTAINDIDTPNCGCCCCFKSLCHRFSLKIYFLLGSLRTFTWTEDHFSPLENLEENSFYSVSKNWIKK